MALSNRFVLVDQPLPRRLACLATTGFDGRDLINVRASSATRRGEQEGRGAKGGCDRIPLPPLLRAFDACWRTICVGFNSNMPIRWLNAAACREWKAVRALEKSLTYTRTQRRKIYPKTRS